MRVLLLTQVLPYPPDSGPKVKTYYVLKYLAQHHDVTLVSFVRDSDKPAYISHLESLCERVITVPITRSKTRDLRYLGQSLFSGDPWMMLRDERPEMRKALAELAASIHFDVVHADQLNMAQYALPFQSSRKVLDLHNALWMLYKRLAETTALTSPMKYILMRDWQLLKRYEGEMCRRFDAVTAVSAEDRALLIEAGARDDITVIPIAIDTDEQAFINRRPSGPHIVHIGTMYWPPNIDGITWFLDQIYPLIKQQVPDVRCTLIGARPPASIVERSHSDRTLTVTGYVDDPLPFLEDSSMMVVPLRAGGGMRVKILNALSQGIPMVSTTLGCEGIRLTNGHDIMIADDPQTFAAETVRLLHDAELNNRITQQGRATVEQLYDYRQACRPLDAIYSAQIKPV
ncbi:MAG: glycosyltransferase family 4 protein [Anaerolineae bacterium]|nr:glycosyltransferase family 4 protein [Anaerolineae bacterium]